VDSKFALTEWALLLSLNQALHPCLLQPEASALVVEPKQAFKHDRASLFALLDHAMSQLKLSFINYERDEINMEKVLEATGLSTDSLNFVELTDLVMTNFKRKQNVNLLAQPGVCENIWYVLALISPCFANDFAKGYV
jgi:acyl carrier protein